ncbi:hypothetical protein ACQY0O_002140 [Thecaphora frezii]
MRFFSLLALLFFALAGVGAAPTPPTTPFVGYLVATFSDLDPSIKFLLSKGDSAFKFSSSKKSIALVNNVGTGGARDPFLVSNPSRTKWWILATDLNIRAKGVTWQVATTHGSRNILVWESEDLVNWSKPRLVQAEVAAAGMAWAPSAVWDDDKQLFYVFWSTRLFDADDTQHRRRPTLNYIRYATTKDFVTLSEPKDYLKLPNTPLIDQEFVKTDQGWSRFLKDENVNKVFQETSTDLFGDWKRIPGYVTDLSPREGPASFKDNGDPNKIHLWLDDYTSYQAFETTNLQKGVWKPSKKPLVPHGLRHGSITPLTEEEYKRFKDAYPA